MHHMFGLLESLPGIRRIGRSEAHAIKVGPTPAVISPDDIQKHCAKRKVGEDATSIFKLARALRSQAETFSHGSQEEDWMGPDQNGIVYKIQRTQVTTSISAKKGDHLVKVTFGQEEGNVGLITTKGNKPKTALLIKKGKVIGKAIPPR